MEVATAKEARALTNKTKAIITPVMDVMISVIKS